ncbi:CocE/NonD family hydrolase [Solimonas marina]|uniref:CocE/NonD family hydrolase n=1 Tax=Solimonas marina TaxID=2714601 RepID=A0A969WAD6_9GAMM|nr:CocE/NonD family hydrolase [Solimonas marina]NKF23612.1 CocE/NonD family hydrolase [Solimonas marina]
MLARARRDGRLTAARFAKAFHEVVDPLDDRTAALLVRQIDISPIYYPFAQRFAEALKAAKTQAELSVAESLALLSAYQRYDAYQAFAEYARPLIEAEDARRYIIEDVQVPTADGASISVRVVRLRRLSGKLPALLNFTIYADPQSSLNEARRSAAHGYVGVEGFTRGKWRSPDAPVAYEDDGRDADAVIDWIARQPWSDGRVGMYGGSYEGFTQWAAAKRLPKALKALMPSVSAAPGIDVPMEGNVFQSFVYYWPLYSLSNKTLDDAMLNDRARWFRMQDHWYDSGRAYRDLPKIDGTPNPAFERWLDHPSYDAYWQSMIPYRQDFAKIDIPVLTTTGYYDGGQIGALYYYQQHREYAPNAESYLLIGPYDHAAGQRGTINALGEPRDSIDGYQIDPAARIDLGALRYDWFDYVFKHKPRPAILKDRVNFEVMGANVWRHVPSIAAMHAAERRFYLTPGEGESRQRLSASPRNAAVTPLIVDLAERKAQDPFDEYGQIPTRSIDDWNGLVFVSAPFDQAVQLNGLFRGDFDVVANKKDFDFEVDLYEQRPDGRYFRLSYYMARASYVQDRSTRHLLTPGAHTHLRFVAGRMTSRAMAKGSRLVMVLSVIKNPYAQINYGTGQDVSAETIADAGAPLKLRWYGDSALTIPLW